MLQVFVITLREGLEAFLIVAISLAFLRKTGRRELVPAVHWGIPVSVLLSVSAGILLQRASNQPLWEGILGITAAIMVYATSAALGARWKLALPLAALSPFAVHLIFGKLLRVPLPAGLLPTPW